MRSIFITPLERCAQQRQTGPGLGVVVAAAAAVGVCACHTRLPEPKSYSEAPPVTVSRTTTREIAEPLEVTQTFFLSLRPTGFSG